MFEFIAKGGFLMLPIIFCSIISLAIILERGWHLHRAKVDTKSLFFQVERYIKEKRLNDALDLCIRTPGPVAKVLAVGIENHENNPQGREMAISRAGSQELRRLGKNLRSLAIIANVTPLLGLLGTVTGMIKAFIKIQELAGRADATVLAGGIWEALITTAAGLIVAIPAMCAHQYFEGRIDDMALEMKEVVSGLFELIKSKD
ncbi:MAG TPA: MotA/TolQ/ExbB proton channel family protein [Syntrophaceae bacterium]|nr:MotA/TolQ/ExbB proton channel family protein [Syntrophaceae bacterium]